MGGLCDGLATREDGCDTTSSGYPLPLGLFGRHRKGAMEEEEKRTGWNDGRNIIKSHGYLILIDKVVALLSYDMKIEKQQSWSFRLASKSSRCRTSGWPWGTIEI